MRPAWFAAVCALALLWSGARAEAAWFCEPLQAFYPAVRACPVPWKSVDPQSGAQPLAIPPAQNATDNAAQTQQSSPMPGDQPTFPAPSSFVRGDVLDQWCRGSTTALLTAICGDDELRDLAVQRLYAFEEAKARLTTDQQKTLIADQNKWAMSYPQACGLDADVQPSLPLAQPLRDCLEKAGRARLQYLKDYGLSDTEKAEILPTPAAPSPPAPATPAPATSSQGTATGPAGTQSPASAGVPSTAPTASQNNEAPTAATAPAPPPNNEAHQVATAPIPPATSPNNPAPSKAGSAPAPHRNSSLAAVANFTRTGAMLIAVIVVAIWAIAAWLRSRRIAKTGETAERHQ
jgi:hypothetical protein